MASMQLEIVNYFVILVSSLPIYIIADETEESLHSKEIKLPSIKFSLDCKDVNGTQGWFPVGTDGGQKIGVCYSTELTPSDYRSPSFDWDDAKRFCESLAVPDESPPAELPKLINEDFIKSFLPNRPHPSDPLSKEDKQVTIPLAAFGDKSALGRLRFKWLDTSDNDKPIFYDKKIFNAWIFDHFDEADGDNIDNYRGFLSMDLNQAGVSDYKPDMIAYKYYNERTTTATTTTPTTTTTREPWRDLISHLHRETPPLITEPPMLGPNETRPTRRPTTRTTTTTPTTTSTTTTRPTTRVTKPPEAFPNITMVFCVKVIVDKEECPPKQLYSPYWYNRHHKTTKGLDDHSYVYKLKPVKLSKFLYAKTRSVKNESAEYYEAPTASFTEETIGSVNVYPFDLVRYDCANHFKVPSESGKLEDDLSYKTAYCYYNLTLTDSIRSKFCYPKSGCILEPCLNEGICEDLTEQELSRQHQSNYYKVKNYNCRCKVPHFGERCEYTSCWLDGEEVGKEWQTAIDLQKLESRGQKYCIHGVCTGNPQQPCECSSSGGPLCAYDFNDCWKDDCKNHGVCVDHRLYSTCICQKGHFGQDCSYTHNECEGKPCKNGGECQQFRTGFVCRCKDRWYGATCEEKPSTTQETVGISLAVSCAVILFFTACCTCLTRLRQNDRKYGRIARMEDDIALLFELAEVKYGADNWLPQEKWVDFIYNETQVIQEVDALDLVLQNA